jgi:hypothetical protein
MLSMACVGQAFQPDKRVNSFAISVGRTPRRPFVRLESLTYELQRVRPAVRMKYIDQLDFFWGTGELS